MGGAPSCTAATGGAPSPAGRERAGVRVYLMDATRICTACPRQGRPSCVGCPQRAPVARCAPRPRCRGWPCGPTALRCSKPRRTAELAARPAAAPLRQAAVSQKTKRAARAAAASALLVATPWGRCAHRATGTRDGHRSTANRSRDTVFPRTATAGLGDPRRQRRFNAFACASHGPTEHERGASAQEAQLLGGAVSTKLGRVASFS